MIDYIKLAETIIGFPEETLDVGFSTSREAAIERISRFFRDYCIAIDISADSSYDISSMGNPNQYLYNNSVTMTLQIPMGVITSDGATAVIDDNFQTVPIEAEQQEEPKDVGRFHNFLKNEES